MTTTESIYGAWLFLLTLAAIALFAGWMSHRGAFLDLAKIFDGLALQVRQAVETMKPRAKPKRQRRSSKDIPIRLVPTVPPGERIDLTTPLAERVGIVTFDGPVTVEPGFPVAGVGGTKAEGEGGTTT